MSESAPKSTMSESELKSIHEKLFRNFEELYEAGDITTIAENMYTDDITIMTPGKEAVRGKQGVFEHLTNAKASGIKSCPCSVTEVFGDGDYMYGRIDYAFVDVNGKTVVEGKGLSVMKKVNGEWYMHSISYS
ncbi:uncharacterized protein LOC144447021 [Glandiceps talaboti]